MPEHPENSFDYGGSQKTLGSYLLGFSLSLLLTVAAFAMVQWKWFSEIYLYLALSILALAQLLVQTLYFLRLNVSAEGRWNLLPFLFTLLVIVILAGGSLWIMYNLNYNMR